MKTTIDAMKQAISALITGNPSHAELAAYALRKAIQQEEAQTVEPVAWQHKDGNDIWVSNGPSGSCNPVPLFTHPAPATEPYDQTSLELCEACGWKTLIPGDCCLNCTRPNPDAPEQEPAGFVDECDDGLFVNLETETGVMVKRGDKLYTKPQPVADLTDAEIRKVQVRHPTENDPMPFARAVLAAQKAKS